MAPAKVLQGAVRLHGLASSPTPEIHVRVAWALASELNPRVTNAAATKFEPSRMRFMFFLLRYRLLAMLRQRRERRIHHREP
jgi:hypothetical protein